MPALSFQDSRMMDELVATAVRLVGAAGGPLATSVVADAVLDKADAPPRLYA